MSKYNSVQSSSTKTVNNAGGVAFKQSNKFAIASFLFTSFLTDTYYKKESQETARLMDLFNSEKDKEFIAKAAVFTRNEYGMRSVSHLAAALLAKDLSGNPIARAFYKRIVRRPDDMMEILGAYANLNGHDLKHIGKLPNAMKRGFADAIGNMDAYQLAKYKKGTAAISMVDVVNLVRPKATEKNGNALKALIEGTLKNEKTWEAKQSKAGQDAKGKTVKEKKELKAEAWKDLLLEGTIGYDALLMNLRNIAETNNTVLIDAAVKLVTDQKRIDKSLTMPFKYFVAYREMLNINNKLANAVSKALSMCLKNIPALEGETLVLVDTSGSMTFASVAKSDIRIAEAAALFGIALNKAMGADVKWFHSTSGSVLLNPEDSITTGMRAFTFNGGATYLSRAIQNLRKRYDNIVIISDMECYGRERSNEVFNAYKKKFDVDTTVFSLDLAGSGTMQFPERNVVTMAGFSDKIFSSMNEITRGPSVLLEKIEAVKL